jgi:hypothetical protein
MSRELKELEAFLADWQRQAGLGVDERGCLEIENVACKVGGRILYFGKQFPPKFTHLRLRAKREEELRRELEATLPGEWMGYHSPPGGEIASVIASCKEVTSPVRQTTFLPTDGALSRNLTRHRF